MNEVTIIGGTKSSKEMVSKVVHWYLKKMLPRFRTLDITVKLTTCYDKAGAYGYCSELDNNREFEIEIDKNLRLYDLVSTLCHELTHLKQYARNEMKHKDDGRICWKKRVYSDGVAYEDLPWEKEAFKLEHQLALECFTSCL